MKTPTSFTYGHSVAKLTETFPLDSQTFKVRRVRRIREGLAVDLDAAFDKDSLFDGLLKSDAVAEMFTISKHKLRNLQIVIHGFPSFDKATLSTAIYAKKPDCTTGVPHL